MNKQINGEGLSVLAEAANRASVRRSVEGEVLVENPRVEFTSMLKEMTLVIYEYVELAGFEKKCSVQDITEAFNTLLEMRLLYVNRSLPKEVAYKESLCPCFLYPFLARVGVYDEPIRALTVVPVSSNQGGGQEKTDWATRFDETQRVLRTLRRIGLVVEYGLPTSREVDSDSVYRVKEENNTLYVVGEVDDITLAVRSLIRIEFNERLFGTARTAYVSVDALKTGVIRLIDLSFRQ